MNDAAIEFGPYLYLCICLMYLLLKYIKLGSEDPNGLSKLQKSSQLTHTYTQEGGSGGAMASANNTNNNNNTRNHNRACNQFPKVDETRA